MHGNDSLTRTSWVLLTWTWTHSSRAVRSHTECWSPHGVTEEHKTLRPNLWRQCRCQIALSNHQYYRELGVDRDHFFMSEKIWKKIFFCRIHYLYMDVKRKQKKSFLYRFFYAMQKTILLFFFDISTRFTPTSVSSRAQSLEQQVHFGILRVPT